MKNFFDRKNQVSILVTALATNLFWVLVAANNQPEQNLTTKAVVKDKYIVLDDHPQHEEKVSGFKLNLKAYAAIFVQSREKLEKARASLVIQGYYKNFTEDYLLDVWSN